MRQIIGIGLGRSDGKKGPFGEAREDQVLASGDPRFAQPLRKQRFFRPERYGLALFSPSMRRRHS